MLVALLQILAHTTGLYDLLTLLYSRRVSTGLDGMSMEGLRPGMGRGPLEEAGGAGDAELLQREKCKASCLCLNHRWVFFDSDRGPLEDAGSAGC